MEAFVSNHDAFLSAACSGSRLSDRSLFRLCHNRCSLASRCRVSYHAVGGHVWTHTESFKHGWLLRSPQAIRWLSSLFDFSRKLLGFRDMRGDGHADHGSSVPLGLSRQVHVDLEPNKEEFSLPIDDKDAIVSLDSDLETARSNDRKRSQDANFTAEKARFLRQELRSVEIWHDCMYHSAIASRLAAPDS